MITVDIQNWKDLRDQFGLEPVDGLRSAKEISAAVRAAVDKKPKNTPEELKDIEHISVSCTTRGEAICLFELVEVRPDKLVYYYTGTAN